MSPASAPVIGLTAYGERARWITWDAPATLLPESYSRAVAGAGGLPVLLPPLLATAAGAAELVTRLDALVLTGGSDVDPARYGQAAGSHTQPPRTDRDAAELALLAAALDAGLPVLAICRGMQLLNVFRGGTLIQHLPDVTSGEDHAATPGTYGHHLVHVEQDSTLATVLGRTTVDVATSHHQGIDELGKELAVTARAGDGIIEAVEDQSRPFLLGVQWHPEAGTDLALMEGLVAAAQDRQAGDG